MLYVWREQNGQHREQKNILKGTRDCASYMKDTSYIHNMKNDISLSYFPLFDYFRHYSILLPSWEKELSKSSRTYKDY